MIGYEFAFLRYRHDLAAGELVNVGAVLWSPDTQQLQYRVNNRYRRLSSLMGSAFDGTAYRELLVPLNKHLQAAQRSAYQCGHRALCSILESTRMDPAGCFVWSETMYGVGVRIEDELNTIYERFVGRYDGEHRGRVDEAKLRRMLDEALKQATVPTDKMETFEAKSERCAYRFTMSWQNGTRKVVEPISFDLKRAVNVEEKALTWSGRLSNLQEGGQQFEFYGLVAPPSDDKLMSAYAGALNILRSSPGVREVLDDKQVSLLARIVVDDVGALDPDGDLSSERDHSEPPSA